MDFYFVKRAVSGPNSNFPVSSNDVSTYPPIQGSTYPMAGVTSLRPNPQTRSTFWDTDATGVRRNLNIGQEQSPMKTPEMPQLPKEGAFLLGFKDALASFSIKAAEDDSEKAPKFTDAVAFQKKLKPGDIILGKHEKPGIDPYTLLIKAFTGKPWGHAMMYAGDGKVVHLSRARKKSGEQPDMSLESATLRDHQLATMARGEYDMLALRPKLPKKDREEAIQRMRDLGHPTYSVSDFLRLGYFPWGKTDVNRLAAENKREELRKKLTSMTCTGAIALAYPKIDFRKNKSALFVRPSDFLNSDLTRSIARYEAPRTKKASEVLLKLSARAKNFTPATGSMTSPGKKPGMLSLGAIEKPVTTGDWGGAIWR